jgi:hypothetical protein
MSQEYHNLNEAAAQVGETPGSIHELRTPDIGLRFDNIIALYHPIKPSETGILLIWTPPVLHLAENGADDTLTFNAAPLGDYEGNGLQSFEIPATDEVFSFASLH